MKNDNKTRVQIINHLIKLRRLRVTSAQAEVELRKNRQFHRLLVDHSRDAVFVVTPEARFEEVNPAACRMLGYDRPSLLKMSIYDIIPPERRAAGLEKFSLLARRGHLLDEIVLLDKGGRLVTGEINATVLPDGNYLGTVRDITERRRFEEHLRESEERYRQLVIHAPAGIYEIDLENLRFLSVNDVMCEYTGYTKEEYLAMSPLDILTEESRQLFIERLQNLFSGIYVPESAEFKIKRKDGDEFWIMTNARNIYRDGRPVVAAVVAHNITERKQVEESLQESKKKFKEQVLYLNTLIDNMNELFYTYDNQANITFVNRKCWDVLGFAQEEVIGRNLLEFVPEENRAQVKKGISKRLEEGEPGSYETLILNREGSKRYLKLNVSPIIRDGEITGGMVLAEDITERKQVEQEMARLDRLNMVGEMAASIGHEVRNPMTTVRGFLQILGDKQECLHYKEFYDLMIEELDRANAIITQFLTLAKNKPVDKKVQNINTIVKAIYPLIQADALKDNKHVVMELSETPDLLLDDKEIRQLILNLARNGLEAMPGRGKLTISTYLEGEEVVLAVRDEGSGIAREAIDKLGTPFFTTKDNGTGLGLAVCYSIVNRHNADIKTETGPGGTTFLIRFK